MKVMKRLTAFLASVCMAVCFIPIVTHAANGQLRFSDPETTVGAKFEVTAKLSADDWIASGNAVLDYDTDYLRFVSGEGVTESGGQLTLAGTADSSMEINWTITFQALAEGNTKIEILTATGTAADGDSIQITHGNSAIYIGPGDPSLIEPETETVSGIPVTINGSSYTVSTKFSDVLVPEGFVKTEVTYEGQMCEAALQESSGKYVMLASASDGGESFFLYDPENGSFVPFCQIYVSDVRYIVLLSEDKSAELPEYLQQTTMTIDGREFIAWQNINDSEYYVVYALNSDGKKGYYQYDTVDATYQRYVPEVVEVVEEATTPVDKLLEKVEENLLLVLLVAAFLILFFFFILIIVSIKLRHRNLELDDLYDEYGIDEDDMGNEEPEKSSKEKKGRFGRKRSDDFDDYEDDDYEDDDYDEASYEEDDYDEDDYEEDDYGDDDYEDETDIFEPVEYNVSDFEDEDDLDDLDALLSARSAQKQASRKATIEKQSDREMARPAAKQSAARSAQKPAVKPAAPRKSAPQPVAPKVGKPQQRVGHSDFDDTFKMDLIDLD